MEKYRIGFLLGSLNGAGAEKTVLTITKHISQLGHEVFLFLLNKKGDYEPPENVSVIDIEGRSSFTKRRLLKSETKALGLDYFVTSRADYFDSIMAGHVYASVHITPSAWEENAQRGFIKGMFKARALRKKFNNKKLIALSEGIRTDLVDNLHCRSDDVVVINNPFELEYIREQAESSESRYSFDYIIYVSSFIERKRHRDLIAAFNMLSDKTIKLVLVGKGPLEDQVRQQVKDLALEDRVVFHGWDRNPYSLIRNAKVSVLASLAEGLPRIVVESIALGVPVVSTDCSSGPNEVLTGDFSSFLVPLKSPEELSIAISRALTKYPDVNDEVVERFDASGIARQYIDLFEGVGRDGK